MWGRWFVPLKGPVVSPRPCRNADFRSCPQRFQLSGSRSPGICICTWHWRQLLHRGFSAPGPGLSWEVARYLQPHTCSSLIGLSSSLPLAPCQDGRSTIHRPEFRFGERTPTVGVHWLLRQFYSFGLEKTAQATLGKPVICGFSISLQFSVKAEEFFIYCE